MIEMIRAHQLNIMLLLCGSCGILIFLLVHTRFISRKRKGILILMELIATFLLWFDRQAYLYAGVLGHTAYVMVRVSNFMVFFLTSAIVFGFDLYLQDLLTQEGKLEETPRRLRIVAIVSALGMVLAVVAAFTNLYYYFDESNTYHRGQGFLIAYIIPVICPIVQYTVIRQYKKLFSRLIYASLLLYIFVPITCGLIQIKAYGISLVNMSMVAVSISLYLFTYLDINQMIISQHMNEVKQLREERADMHKVFDQVCQAFTAAAESRDEYRKENGLRCAEYAKKIAQKAGKSEEYCAKVYYAALLHEVGKAGVNNSAIEHLEDPERKEEDVIRKIPEIGGQILSCIEEYPFLADAARYCHERYDGKGYPEGLKGDQIPEIARIVTVADAYVTMKTNNQYRDKLPDFIAREAFVKGAGEEYDPEYADLMVRILDAGSADNGQEEEQSLEEELTCNDYREHILRGIPIELGETRIEFDCGYVNEENMFSAPALVLFDSYDGRSHDNRKAIEGYQYLEYGELWFDEHCITTAARKIKQTKMTETQPEGHYLILAGRYEDHLRLVMQGPVYSKEVIVALPSVSRSAYIGLTGEHCRLSNIRIYPTGKNYTEEDIERIAKEITYTDHMESDIPNINIDRPRSAASEGIEIKERLRLAFHTMSLPGASLVWHCPYIVLFSSDDGTVGGPNYHEYDLIKLSGENNGTNDLAQVRFTMKKLDTFPGWEVWKEANKEGLECEISVEKKKNQIHLKTQHLGISMESTTTILDERDRIYLALTGDQVALTDIRIM